MRLGNLKIAKGSTKRKKRVGRGHGSGLGRSSGRGDKGYHSRSGSKHRPWFEGGQMPLHRRVPKRGFLNSDFKKEFQLVNLSDIEKINLDNISPAILKDHGVIKYSLRPVKILGDGVFTKKINISASAFSKSAIKKIEKLGGKVEVC
ncbi:MAG: 50S ribosomal protein L15 [Candidatus Marinimicrobia bacterium]|nr:50S ribosomal protein L15 [Candidatus Neomarinimicrobiota bacterium]